MQDQLYYNFVTGQTDEWEKTIKNIEQYYDSFSTPSVLYDLLLARYGFIAMNLSNKNNDVARKHLEKAEKEIEVLFNYRNYLSKAYAMRGTFFAFRISLNPFNTITLGNKANSYIEKAIEADPSNPTAWMEKGNSSFYRPSAFGGSKENAVKYYKKAISLFEKNMHNNYRWLYLNTLTSLAKSYEYTGDYKLEIETYNRILEIEPNLTIVKNELLPAAIKRNN